jgi:hypothetical protein
LHLRPERDAHRGGEQYFAGIGGQPVQCGVDRVQRAVGLEEEIAADLYLRQMAIDDRQVDHHQLAAGNLVFAVHGHPSCLPAPSLAGWAGTGRTVAGGRGIRDLRPHLSGTDMQDCR